MTERLTGSELVALVRRAAAVVEVVEDMLVDHLVVAEQVQQHQATQILLGQILELVTVH